MHRVEPGGLHSALATCGPGDDIVLAGVHLPVAGPVRKDAEGWSTGVTVTAEEGAALTRLSLRQPHVTLDGVTFLRNPEEDDDPSTPDGSLLYLNPQAHHFRLIRSKVYSTGIMVRSSHVEITDNDISGLSPDGTPGQQLDGVQIGNGATDVLVTRNLIHDFPYEDTGGYHPDGVQVFDAKRVVVTGNRVWNIGNSAFILSGGRGWGIEDAVVARNVLLSDKGAVDVREPSAHRIVFVENEVGNLRLGAEKGDELKGLVADRLLIRYLGLKESRPTNSVIEKWNLGFGNPHPALADASLGNRRSEDEPITLVAPRPPVNEWAAQWLGDAPAPPVDPEPEPEPPVEPDPPVDPEPDPPAPVDPPVEPDPQPPVDPDLAVLRAAVADLDRQVARLAERHETLLLALHALSEQNAALTARLEHAEREHEQLTGRVTGLESTAARATATVLRIIAAARRH